MLRLLVNLLILFFLIRLLRPVFQKAGQFFRRGAGDKSVDGGTTGAPSAEKKKEYDELTPYEIEDADFEEIRRDGQ